METTVPALLPSMTVAAAPSVLSTVIDFHGSRPVPRTRRANDYGVARHRGVDRRLLPQRDGAGSPDWSRWDRPNLGSAFASPVGLPSPVRFS
jgi:hypothetical protein